MGYMSIKLLQLHPFSKDLLNPLISPCKHFTFELAVVERTNRGSGGAGRSADRTSCEKQDSQSLSGCENH